jgi:4-amino-4-deoxy-L-arabinose transferase-like glycosyltransferase
MQDRRFTPSFFQLRGNDADACHTARPTASISTHDVYAVACLALAAFVFLYGLGALPLLDINEGLYAQVAREMLASGRLVVPHALGVPYIEKPPLLYWLMALSFRLFGMSEASARLVSALPMFCLCTAMLIFLVRHWGARVAWLATLILSTMLPVAMLSHSILFDPLLTALFGMALLAFLHAYFGAGQRWIQACAVLLGLATMEKGIVSLLLAAGIGAVFFWQVRDRRCMTLLRDPVALLLFGCITVPWHIAAIIEQDGFAWFYLVNEHVLRYLGLRSPHDYHLGSPLYYLPRFLGLLLPWTPLLVLMLWRPRSDDRNLQAMRAFCAAWILFPLLFFTTSQAKSHYYLVIVTPAVAILAALEIDLRIRQAQLRQLAHCVGACMAIAVLGAGAVWWLPRLDQDWTRLLGGRELLTLAAAAAAWSGTVRLMRSPAVSPHMPEAAPMLVGAVSAMALVGALATVQARSPEKSSLHVARVVAGILADGTGDRAVFSYRDFEDVFGSLPFYLRGPVRIIDSVSNDLQFGCAHAKAPSDTCISLPDFNRFGLQHKVAVVVTDTRLRQFLQNTARFAWQQHGVGDKWVLTN